MKKRNKLLLFDLAGIDFPGGCEKYFANLAKYFSLTYEVTAVTSGQYRTFMDFVYFIVSRRKLNSLSSVKRDIGDTRLIDIPFSSLLPLVRSHINIRGQLLDADTIYAKNEFQELAYLYGMLGKKEYKKRVVVGVHTPLFVPDSIKGLWRFAHDLEYHSSLYKCFLKNAKLIHVNNSDYKELLVEAYSLDKKNIIHIPNPIDWRTRFSSEIDENHFIMLWLGRFTSQKGIDRLKRIVTLLDNDMETKHIKIIIGGSGELIQEVKELASTFSFVEYHGFIAKPEKYYEKADVSIFTAYFDTFAHAVLEPLSFGVPVISYDIPGPRDMVESGNNGFLVKGEEEFISAIKTLIAQKKKDYKDYLSYKNNIFVDTNSKFNSQKIFSKIEKELIRY